LLLGGCASTPRPGVPTYVVQRGDTLYSIAARLHVDYHELARVNGIGAGFVITPGQTLHLPGMAPAAVVHPAPAATAPVSVPRPVPDSPAPAWLWPTDGAPGATVHQPTGGVGLEIAAALGAEVRAAAAGRVVYTGEGLRGYGQLVIIKHDETWLTAYGYNRELSVHEGDAVTAGEHIAAVGEGPGHRAGLYFEIRRNGRPVDPLEQLPARP
jgi:lipoprotein NlpD